MNDSWQPPDPTEVGRIDTEWTMPNGDVIYGHFIAHWSSRRKPIWSRELGQWIEDEAEHEHPGPVVPAGWKCSACRWFEMSLWRTDEGEYVLVRHNVTTVPGEQSRIATARIDHPMDIVNLPGLGPNHRPLRQLLMKAAEFDTRIAELGV